MKATRFMRKPFFVTGYEVTDENMEVLARWCEGHIIGAGTDKSFIRVPVLRPTSPRQAEAYVGMWIIVSLHHDRKSFKVYTKIKLDREFIPLGEDEMLLDDLEIDCPDIVVEENVPVVGKPLRPRGGRALPAQSQPTTTLTFQTTR